MPRVKYAMNYRPENSFSMSYASCMVIFPCVPEKPWEDLWTDFITGLPECEGFDAIWVVMDRQSKMRHFAPCRMTVDA